MNLWKNKIFYSDLSYREIIVERLNSFLVILIIFIAYDPLERFFSALAIFILIDCSLFYLSRARKREFIDEKILMLGFASFWLSLALARIFFYFTDYFLEGTYTGDLSRIFHTYNFENYIFLYFYLYFFIYLFIIIISLSCMFFWFSIRAKQEFQAISSIMTIGFTLFLIGWFLDSIIVKSINLTFPTIPYLFMIIGTLISISPQFIEFKLFSTKFSNSFVLITISIILIFFSLIAVFNLPTQINSLIIIWISVTIFISSISYVLIYVIKSIRTPKMSKITSKEKLEDLIRVLTRPDIITIKDVNFSREKKICLVCKGKISRLNYTCPGCDALYCIICSEALSDLENACWYCKTPFDESKLIKDVVKVEDIKMVAENLIHKEGETINESNH